MFGSLVYTVWLCPGAAVWRHVHDFSVFDRLQNNFKEALFSDDESECVDGLVLLALFIG